MGHPHSALRTILHAPTVRLYARLRQVAACCPAAAAVCSSDKLQINIDR